MCPGFDIFIFPKGKLVASEKFAETASTFGYLAFHCFQCIENNFLLAVGQMDSTFHRFCGQVLPFLTVGENTVHYIFSSFQSKLIYFFSSVFYGSQLFGQIDVLDGFFDIGSCLFLPCLYQ